MRATVTSKHTVCYHYHTVSEMTYAFLNSLRVRLNRGSQLIYVLHNKLNMLTDKRVTETKVTDMKVTDTRVTDRKVTDTGMLYSVESYTIGKGMH